MTQVSIGDNVEFECSNGGVLQIIGDDGSTNYEKVGSDGSFAYYDDLYINSYNDMTVDVDGEYHTQGTVQHVTGEPVMWFNLISNEPNGKADFSLTGLQPGSWYRLEFGGVIAKTASGRAHGRANDFGRVDFTEVVVPND